MCPICIKGDASAIETCVALIEKKFGDKGVSKPANKIETLWILDADVPRLIGSNGMAVKARTSATGVKYIYADQKRVDSEGRCPVRIEGPPANVEKAMEGIRQEFDNWTCDERVSKVPTVEIPGTKIQHTFRGHISSIPGSHFKPANRSFLNQIPDSVAAVESTRVVATEGMTPTSRVTAGVSESFFDQLDVRTCNDREAKGRTPLLDDGTTAVSYGIVDVTSVPAAATEIVPTKVDVPRTAASLVEDANEEGGIAHQNAMIDFLHQHRNCLTCTPAEFSDWLSTVGVETLDDLAEALEDEDFAKEEMKPNGLKYFKRHALRKAAVECGPTEQAAKMKSLAEPKFPSSATKMAPPELICPISFELMVRDPVLALDGFTYERRAIEDWFATKTREGVPLLSPQTQQVLPDATLTPNVALRTMARDFASKNQDPNSWK